MRKMVQRKGARDSPRARSVVHVPTSVEPVLREIGRLAERLGVAVYAVGGCVRDWLLGIAQTTDLDLTVEGDGIRFAQALAKRSGAKLTTHTQFGTATIVMTPPSSHSRRRPRVKPSALRIDIATCRKEVYREPAAYPKVSRGTLRDDLFRRDFTINAMAMALKPNRFGSLVDPFGGAGDLAVRTIRVLHPQSFIDDPSRILRAVRFSHRFGFTLELATERALQHAIARGSLGKLNRGRWRKELKRLMEEPDPRGCLRRLEQWLSARVS